MPLQRFSSMLIRRRIALVFLMAALFSALLILRLSYLQIVQADRLASLALEQRLRPVPLLAQRGVIYDRNMNILAASMSFEAAYAIPVEVENPEEAAQKLAPILKRPVEEIENRLTQQTRYLDKLVDELAKGRKMEKILRVG